MIFPTYLLKLPECLKGKIEWDLQVTESMRSLCRQIVWRRERKKRNKVADQVGNDWMLPDSEKLILFKLFLWLHSSFCVTRFSFALLCMYEFIFRMSAEQRKIYITVLQFAWETFPKSDVSTYERACRKHLEPEVIQKKKPCKFIISSLGNSSVYLIVPIRFFTASWGGCLLFVQRATLDGCHCCELSWCWTKLLLPPVTRRQGHLFRLEKPSAPFLVLLLMWKWYPCRYCSIHAKLYSSS